MDVNRRCVRFQTVLIYLPMRVRVIGDTQQLLHALAMV